MHRCLHYLPGMLYTLLQLALTQDIAILQKETVMEEQEEEHQLPIGRVEAVILREEEEREGVMEVILRLLFVRYQHFPENSCLLVVHTPSPLEWDLVATMKSNK